MTEDVIALAKLRLEELLTFFGLNTKVRATEDGNSIALEVDADTTGRLIGHRGETLRAIQYLLNLMVRNQAETTAFISIDIGGYKKARADHLAEQAKTLAEKVIRTGNEEAVGPLTPAERRVIHMTLADMPEISTESTGQDPHRRLIIRKSA